MTYTGSKYIRQWLVVLMILGLGTTVLADQTDSRLNSLFESLQKAKTQQQALALEQEIWAVWFHIEGAKEQQIMKQANQLVAMADFVGAKALYDQLIQLSPNYAEAWNRRATLNYLMADYTASLEDVERTLELEPRHFGAWSGLALIMTILDKPIEALKAYQKVLGINPQSVVAQQQIKKLQDELKIFAI